MKQILFPNPHSPGKLGLCLVVVWLPQAALICFVCSGLPFLERGCELKAWSKVLLQKSTSGSSRSDQLLLFPSQKEEIRVVVVQRHCMARADWWYRVSQGCDLPELLLSFQTPRLHLLFILAEHLLHPSL